MIDTILFDMDGTLLPVDTDTFTKTYFKLLCARVAPFGYKPEDFIAALWQGTKAMVKNDGSRVNGEAFWTRFEEIFGAGTRTTIEPVCNDFYGNEFNKVRDILNISVDHSALINSLRAKGYSLVLASNPMFPTVAMRSRLSWVGLEPEQFVRVTDYCNSSFCKPNSLYYNEIFEKTGKRPEQCLIVGNNVDEDACAVSLGANVYLVDDMLEGDAGRVNEFTHGSFADFCKYAEALPDLNG